MIAETAPLRALSHRILVEPLEEPDRIRGLYLPMSEALVFRVGKVHSIGAEAARLLPTLRVGAHVLYSANVSATNVMRDRHVTSPDAVLCEVDEGVTARELDARWLGAATNRIEFGKPRRL